MINSRFIKFILLLNFIIVQGTLLATEEGIGLSLEKMLLMPGDVTAAHAELENKCESCHVHFDKDNQSPLCVECHEVVQQELKDKLGYHGKLEQSQISDCSECHTDHKGRSFDITGLDRDLFDHSKTDFPIIGKHQSIACDTCHQLDDETLPVDKGFRFKQFQCASCHEDFHKEQLGDKCEDCHSEDGWEFSAFDHDNTEFKLLGSHEKTVCISCHVDKQFKKMDPACKSCHLATDSHLGVFGTDCQNCHTAEYSLDLEANPWSKSSFNHTKDTEYKLLGKHKDATCISCHQQELKPATECSNCHLDEDIHQGSNGKQCNDCHNNEAWDKTEFSHEQPLTGKHLDVSCDVCHTPGEKQDSLKEPRQCVDCHHSNNPHDDALGNRCQTCHQTDDWKESVTFNHDFSSFALTGSHQLLVCEACHLSNDFSNQPSDCMSCHSEDDYHQKSLGEDCETCHDTSVWTHWRFDHDNQTEYPLTGSHQNLQCQLCHAEQTLEPLKPPTECIACHSDDDVHEGGFGTDCKQCHNDGKFEETYL